MAAYVNFYETIKEAEMRLKGTVILYDGEPHYVLCICDHKADGIFRVYLDPIGQEGGLEVNKHHDTPIPYSGPWNPAYGHRGQAMDKWMEDHPKSKILRKMMNSPSFNKFRPFPLGMMNYQGSVYYVERSPTRKSEQGLTTSMISHSAVRLSNNKAYPHVDTVSPEFREMVLGNYPSAAECLQNLKNPEKTNESAAFDRSFAFVRGPIDLLFLAYKQDIIGVLPSSSFSNVKLGKKFLYTREAVEGLGLFNAITD